MTQRTPLMTQKTRNFAHKAMKALGFVNLNRLSESQQPALVAPTASARRATAHGAAPTPHPVAVQAPPCGFQIDREDWDAMFRAIQVRLARAVDEQRGWVSVPQAGDADAHLQTVVLECVAAMTQLQAALTQERACTDASGGRAGQP